MGKVKKPQDSRPPRARTKTRRAAKKASPPLSPSQRTWFDDKWDGFVDSVIAAIKSGPKASGVTKATPYDQRSAILKRNVYEFVGRWSGHIPPNQIAATIEKYRISIEKQKSSEARVAIRRMRKPFNGNEFYYVFMGLKSALSFKDNCSDIVYRFDKYDVTRYSYQLHYADRHNVPLEFLIGFLYQSGSIAEVCRKAKDPVKREAWYLDKHAVR